MIQAYDSYKYTYYCMVWGCAMLMGPMAFFVAFSIIYTVWEKIKKWMG